MRPRFAYAVTLNSVVALLGVVALTDPVRGQGEVAAEIRIEGTGEISYDYVTWAPSLARIRLTKSQGNAVTVVLTNDPSDAVPAGGDVLFAEHQTPWSSERRVEGDVLQLTLPGDGSWVNFVLAGKFRKPSSIDKDAIIEIHSDSTAGPIIGRHALMVRVRKNANNLSSDERRRFLAALATLRNRNPSAYLPFDQIHRAADGPCFPGHGGPAFLPWHRVYLVQFERELQKVDPSVALHYWKFDEKAEQVFTKDFMGANKKTGTDSFEIVELDPNNPLFGWTTEDAPIQRSGLSEHLGIPQLQDAGPINVDTETLALGSIFLDFALSMEGNPHGYAHVWIGGWMGNPRTAVRDPIFFLLHSNVERLWAEWQRAHGRFGNTAADYSPTGKYVIGKRFRIGHFRQDSMWPWNGVKGPTPCRRNQREESSRPDFATAPLPSASSSRLGPTQMPTPADVVDYWGLGDLSAGFGYAYDDVAYATR